MREGNQKCTEACEIQSTQLKIKARFRVVKDEGTTDTYVHVPGSWTDRPISEPT